MKYTLIADLGNTNVKFNIFRGEKLVCTTFVQIHHKDFIFGNLKILEMLKSNSIHRRDIVDGMIFSVVPSLNKKVRRIIRSAIGINLPIFKNKDINFNMVGIPDMNEIGADLLGDIIGGIEIYKTPLMICDFGTVSKSLFINEKNELIGVTFIPGLDVSLQTMANKTEKLPSIHIKKPKTWYGNTTVEAMNSGAYYSNVCAARHFRQMMEKDYKKMTFVIAGGHASMLNEHLKPDFVEPNLAAIGMNTIYRKYLKK